MDNWTFLFCNHQFSQYITALCLIYGRSVFLKITYSVIFRLVSLRFVSPLSAVRTFFFSLVPTFETCTIQNMSSSLSQLWWTWVLNAAVIKLQCSSCLSPETERNALCFLSSWSGCFFPPGSSCWSVGVSDVSLSPSFIISEEDTGLCLGPSCKMRTWTSQFKTECLSCNSDLILCLKVSLDSVAKISYLIFFFKPLKLHALLILDIGYELHS